MFLHAEEDSSQLIELLLYSCFVWDFKISTGIGFEIYRISVPAYIRHFYIYIHLILLLQKSEVLIQTDY